MSLYEASAHLFYGHRIQRTGRDGDTNPPLGKVASYGYVEDRIVALGHALPDWQARAREKYPADSGGRLVSKEMSDRTSELARMYDERTAMIEKLSFGCELVEMGGSDAEDMVLYAVIKESDKSCSSEDDHGGFGERVLKPEDMVKGGDWDARLRDFSALLGLLAETVKPRWTLSMRG